MNLWFEIVYTIGCITITVAVALATYAVVDRLCERWEGRE